MKILIGAPLKQKAHIFKEHLESLKKLVFPEEWQVDFYWVVNDCPEVIPILEENHLDYCVKNYGWDYKCDESEHHWDIDGIMNMCNLRNILLRKMLYEGYDFYFSVDTDLILHPDTLNHLVGAKKPLVSEVFWTKGPDGNYWSNAWMFDQCSNLPENVELWRTTKGVFPVGGTGACFLIRRDVIEHGVSYSRIPNILKCVLGEDRYFCIRAICMGYDIYLDTYYPCTHLYRESEYIEYMKGKEKCSI